jgi:FeS assembly SUF system regulator
MLKISKLTDYATVLLAHLASQQDQLLNVAALSQATHIAKPSVAKIMKALHQAGLVHSTRGALGGYELAKPAKLISAAHIIDAVEGPQGLTDCAKGNCDRAPDCQVGHSWQQVHLKIRKTLEELSLAELSSPAQSAQPPISPWVKLGDRPTRREALI